MNDVEKKLDEAYKEINRSTLRIKDFICEHLRRSINDCRYDIRQIKKYMKGLEQLTTDVKAMSETQLKDMMDKDPEMWEKYKELAAQMDEREDKQIKELVESGAIREVHYDSKEDFLRRGIKGNSSAGARLVDEGASERSGVDADSSDDNKPEAGV